jgi:hypothetical protein
MDADKAGKNRVMLDFLALPMMQRLRHNYLG